MDFAVFKSFRDAESGAVTTDWTVITAAVTGLGIATTGALYSGVSSLSGDIGVSLENFSISASFDPAPTPAPVLLGLSQAAYETYSATVAGFTDNRVLRQIENFSIYENVTAQGTAAQRRRHDRLTALRAEARRRGLL